eukprot:GHVO01016926.1.p2 GENE.GHVO01016926.1~~GHVO01016926.1.p2  ORF type:complete len:107 (-),score=6.77 GHVO01016926.1:95-415(-)
MDISYICLTAGVIPIRMTLHLPQSSSVELYWTKACRQPVAREAATVSSAAIFGGVIAILSLLCCFLAFTKAGACIRVLCRRMVSRMRQSNTTLHDTEETQGLAQNG